MTKKIERRNENIRRDRKKGMTFRALGRRYKKSHTQIMNICNEGQKEKVEVKKGTGVN